jgi:hypothetical protein
VKIELTEAEAETGLHHHSELWIRVLTSEPLECTPDVPERIRKQIPEEILAKYARTLCAWHEGIWEDDDPERQQYGFEQWLILPSIGSR